MFPPSLLHSRYALRHIAEGQMRYQT